MLKREFVLAVGITAALLTGCEKKEATPAPATQQEAAKTQPEAATPVPTAGSAVAFSTSLPAPIAKKFGLGGKANVDRLNKKSANKYAEVKSADGFELDGWAIDEANKAVPETVAIELVPAGNGAKYYAMATRNKRNRDDVVKFFKEPAYKNSAFALNADIKAVPAGEYQVIVVQLIDGKPQRAYPSFKVKKLD